MTGHWPEGCGIAFGDEYIVSVTEFTFVSQSLHDEELVGAVKKYKSFLYSPFFCFAYRFKKILKMAVSCSPNCHLERSCMSI